MIVIEDNDFPIDVAIKIIKGTRPVELSRLEKELRAAVMPGSINPEDTMDMFNLEEIKEIADYLMVYYGAHGLGD